MKKLLVFMLMMVVCGAEAKRAMPTAEDRAQMERATEILWRESDLTENEMQLLMKLVGYRLTDVSAYAFCVAVVRTAQDTTKWHDVCRKALELGESSEARRIAEILKDIDGELTVKKLVKLLRKRSKVTDESKLTYRHKDAWGYCHDILAYLLIREARREGRPAVIPPDVRFDVLQKELLEYAFKPEREAWGYLYAKIKELDKRTLPVLIPENREQYSEQSYEIYTIRHRVVHALTMYSKVFFKEVAAAMRSGNVTDRTRECLQDYMWDIWTRLDSDEQMKAFAELEIQLDRPQAKVTEILWREEEPTEDDLSGLLRLIDGPSEQLSAYAMSVIMARCPSGMRLRKMADDVLKLDLHGKRNTRAMAEYIRKNRGVVTVERLREMLKQEKNTRGVDSKQPEDYYRDVLVCLLLCKARKNGQRPVVWEDICWNEEQRWRLQFGFKPTDEAWNFLYPKLTVDPTKRYYESPRLFFLYVASSYPKVFFEEAMTAARSEDVQDDGVRNAMVFYLACNDHRLDEWQLKRYFELLEERKIPWHFLWGKPSF